MKNCWRQLAPPELAPPGGWGCNDGTNVVVSEVLASIVSTA